MPPKKKGGKRGSDKGTVVVQALSSDERHRLREAQEIKDRKQAKEGSEPYWVASQIWSKGDGHRKLEELSGYQKEHFDAQCSAIQLRVLALACQAFNPAAKVGPTVWATRCKELKSYSEVFHSMGYIQVGREISHRAVWIKREYSGLQAELDNITEETNNQSESLYYTLLALQDSLGCAELLAWLKEKRNDFGNELFGDYTNHLMRSDAKFPIRSTPPAKMRLHKGDFASYMTQLLQGKSAKAVLNPDTLQTFSLEGLTSKTSDGYAVDQKYEVRDARNHGQGYFNGNHNYDQLNHQLIECAMKSYSAGSSMFWTSFVFASMIDAITPARNPNDIVREIQNRSDLWMDMTKRLPIPKYMLDVATVLATQFALGYKKILFKNTPSIEDILRRAGESDEETQNSGAAGAGNSTPSWSDVTRKNAVKSLRHTTRLLERMHIDETLWNELSEENDRVDIKTPAFARVAQLRSGDSHAEPDEVNQRSFSRPGIVNCTTPTAFARAEHREPMCNHFYS